MSPLERYLTELRDTTRPVVMSKLARLSELSPEETEVFKREWPGIDVARRRQIVERLTELVEDNFDLDFKVVCFSCLSDSDSEVRVKAIEGLWLYEERSLIDPLVNLLLKDESYTARAAAANALGKFTLLAELGKLSSSDTRKIEAALLNAFNKENEHTNVRCKALEAISSLNNPQVEKIIRRAYQSNIFEFQVSAIYAMGQNCNRGWLPVLLKELHSLNAQLKFEAVEACAKLEAEEAVPRLIELVKDDDPEVQMSAIEALGHIGSDEALEALRKCLDSGEEHIRKMAQEALDEIRLWEDPFNLY